MNAKLAIHQKQYYARVKARNLFLVRNRIYTRDGNQATLGGGRMRRLKVGSDEEERERRDTSCLREGLVSTMRVRCGRPPGLEFANNKLIARRSTLDKR